MLRYRQNRLPYPSNWVARPHQAQRLWALGLSVALAGCTQTNVVPVTVGDITVVPDRVDAFVSDQEPLGTEIRDQDGNVLPDRELAWSSLDPTVVTVDQQGVLTAVGPGQALVTASADGAVGSAQVTVRERPTVRISPTQISVETTRGSNGTINRTVDVENAGGGTLTGLGASVVYDGGGSGWLTARLSSTAAPATLTVTARGSGLPTGTHQARVVVSTSDSSAELPVSFEVTEPPAEIHLSGSNLEFTVIGGRSTPQGRTLQITNGGGGSLTGLNTQITYDSGSGWLAATLSGSSAPASITVRPSTTALTPGSYSGTVQIRSPVASTKSVSVSYQVLDPRDFEPPDRPTRLRAREDGPTEIDLDWRDNSDNETRFEVERRRSGEAWVLVATLPKDSKSFTDTGLAPETWHQYRVRACNAGGCSTYSNWDAAWTEDD